MKLGAGHAHRDDPAAPQPKPEPKYVVQEAPSRAAEEKKAPAGLAQDHHQEGLAASTPLVARISCASACVVAASQAAE